MYDLATMEAIQRKAIKQSKIDGKSLYLARYNKDEGVFSCPVTAKKVKGYTLVNTYFVDNSGFGAEDELALTAREFLDKVKAGFYYSIVSQGQFQVYIGEFKKRAQA